MSSVPLTETDRNLHPLLRQAMAFTDVYRQHRDSHPAVREAACLRAQYPSLLGDIAPGDPFAGSQVKRRLTYVGSIWWARMPHGRGPGKQGGYCFDFAEAERLAKDPANTDAVSELADFWRKECTWSKIRATWDEDLKRLVGAGGPVGGGGCGFVLAAEVDRLLQLGLPGLGETIDERTERARREGETDKLDFLRGLREAVDLLIDICRHYEAQAREQAAAAQDEADRGRLERIAADLDAITARPPRTLSEAIQLWWLYSIVAGGKHVEGWRLDVALGDFYAADIDEGRLTEEEAIELVCDLWRMFDRYGDRAVCRGIVGGRGRRNEQAADRFCLAAMEATRRLRTVIPQLTLRFYDGQDPALLDKAFDVIGEGCTYPMLYNDDVNIPGVVEALNVPEADAERYYPLGCGEYMIGGASPSLLNLVWSVPKTLEAALLGGVNFEGKTIGATGPTEFDTFEELREALSRQIACAAEVTARVHARNNAVLPRECSFLLGSLVMDDCLERGLGILDGGARYTGACVMAHGFTNTADALVAIRRLVFEERSVSLEEVVDAMRTDFDGREDLRRRLQAEAKFGNDHDEVDEMLVALWREISRCSDEAGRREGMDFLTVSSVNPGGYGMGKQCGATADGRKAGQPFAIGNAPTAGADTSGITALLNSVSKVDPANGGATTNVKLAKSMFAASRPKLEALFSAYWRRGGMQASVTVVDQAELERAMEHPEEYPNLLVRVGGWTARFIDCDEDVQREIIRRTVY